jgi:hypothetical protein
MSLQGLCGVFGALPAEFDVPEVDGSFEVNTSLSPAGGSEVDTLLLPTGGSEVDTSLPPSALRLTLRPRQRSKQSLMTSANSRIEALYLTGDSRYFLQASRQAGLIRSACDQRSFLQQSL